MPSLLHVARTGPSKKGGRAMSVCVKQPGCPASVWPISVLLLVLSLVSPQVDVVVCLREFASDYTTKRILTNGRVLPILRFCARIWRQ